MNQSFVTALEARLGSAAVSTEPALLDTRRHDYWVLSHLDDSQGRPAPRPLCVVQPTRIEQVVACVDQCRENGVSIVPFGLGSGVCGGVLAHPDRVVLDLSQLNRTRSIDAHNLLASFDAGKRGSEAEADVAARGLTIGHWPQSVAVSSVGGWVATRASGQFSTAYGNIEDIVYAIEAVLADGSVIETGKAPRAAAGPDLRHLLLGSEGTLGVITGVTLSLQRKAEAQDYSAYHIGDLAHGFEFQRELVQLGWRPPVMRQYDAIEAQRSFAAHARADHGMLILVHEGPAARVAAELAAIDALARTHHFKRADTAAATGWLDHRNHVPHWNDFLKKGIVVDTAEISATWDRIGGIYDRVIASLREVPDVLNASAHSSHVYPSGLNLYFSFAVRPGDTADMRSRYLDCWQRIMTETAAGGGGVAHHHGIGRLRRDFLHHDLGASGLAALRAIKSSLDPSGLFNPGVLIPDA
ncbi:MAG: FAD-binding oxidoreductase [Gammaproteobacteria bacterium]|nr:FAD-binding oxidoreductase [Gammaproteobacteria bacterium]